MPILKLTDYTCANKFQSNLFSQVHKKSTIYSQSSPFLLQISSRSSQWSPIPDMLGRFSVSLLLPHEKYKIVEIASKLEKYQRKILVLLKSSFRDHMLSQLSRPGPMWIWLIWIRETPCKKRAIISYVYLEINTHFFMRIFPLVIQIFHILLVSTETFDWKGFWFRRL